MTVTLWPCVCRLFYSTYHETKCIGRLIESYDGMKIDVELLTVTKQAIQSENRIFEFFLKINLNNFYILVETKVEALK